MSAAQLDLDFAERPAADAMLEARLRELLDILHENKGWMKRRDLEAMGFGERELRVLAEYDQAATIFSYPGSPGYKHFDHVTDAEFDRCGALRSQARGMLRRLVRYERRWHRRGGRS